MKKFVLLAVGLIASVMTVQAQSFYPTNLVLMELAGTATSGSQMTLAQYTTSGGFVSLVSIPDSGQTNELICGGGSSTEGYISLSENGAQVVFAGYNTNVGAFSVALSSSGANTNWRGVGTLDGYGNYALQYAGNFFSATSIRGAVSDGFSNFWVNGGNTGILYLTNGAPPVTISTTTLNERGLTLSGGNLYFSDDSAAGTSLGVGFFEVPGLPTTAGANNAVSGAVGGSSVEGLVVNTNFNGTGIAYVCDDDNAGSFGGIVKFTNNGNGGTWGSNYTIATGTGAYQVAVNWSGTHPVLYFTQGDTTISTLNALATVTDTGVPNPAITVLATAPSGTTFRGICWAPGAYPTISPANEPASVTNDYGQTGTFTVTPGGTAPFSYQWYSNNLPSSPTFVAISGATNATLSLPNLTAGESNTLVYVVVSNAYGTVQSSDALLTVDPPGPPINVTVTPSATNINATGSGSFTVSFAGAVTGLSYGWTLNGTNLQNGSLGSSTISGATTATLTIANAFAVDDGTYVAFVTNSFSSGNSSNNPGVLSVNDPAIITPIKGATNAPGGPTDALTVTAVGSGLSYSWLSNGNVIIGANTSTYTPPSNAGSNTTIYSVVVHSSDGNSTTNSTVVSYTPVLIYEPFNYPTGANLFTTPGTQWTDINGSMPELVSNNYVQINQAESTTDAQDLFAYPVSNTVVWASFIINVATNTSTLPSGGGIYFANFEDTNFNFYADLYLLSTNATENLSSGQMTPGVPDTAWPGTYRIGISLHQGDSANSSSTGPSAVVPLDMAPGINYEVVVFLDLGAVYAQLAVNPASYNDIEGNGPLTGVCSGPTPDSILVNNRAITEITNFMAGFGLRQRANTGETEGLINITDLECSWDWNGYEDGGGYTVVTGAYSPAKPVIGLQPVGTTNYSGNPWEMEIAASGIGQPGIGLTYAWYQGATKLSDGTNITGTATPAISFGTLLATNTGTYYCLVTGATGTLTNYSSNAVISVNTTPTAPSFTASGGVEPVASATTGQGGTVTFDSTAIGTGPVTYQWYFNNGANTVTSGGSSSSGNLTLANLVPSQSGTYYCIATGGTGLTGQSTSVALTVTAPVVTTIGYLRSLVSPGDTPTVSDTRQFIITGTNLLETNAATGGNTASMYIEDATGGINVFVTLGENFRPLIGDVISATGTLEMFDDNLELDCVLADVTDNTSPMGSQPNLPTPVYLPWSDIASGNTITASYLDTFQAGTLSPSTPTEGALVYLTNVYFSPNGTANNGAGGTTVQLSGTFTNAAYGSGDYPGLYYPISSGPNGTGTTFQIYVPEEDTNFNGSNIPPFAVSVSGVVIQDEDVFTLLLPTYASIVVPPATPPAITNLSGSINAGKTGFTLIWPAQANPPGSATYSVKYSSKVNGPYTNLATGLTFATTNGTYTDSLRTNSGNFYEVSSP